MRYYQAHGQIHGNVIRTNYVDGNVNDSGYGYSELMQYPVPMRATPTVTSSDGSVVANSTTATGTRFYRSNTISPGQSNQFSTIPTFDAEL